jgi:dihydroflavonol-4-reductase
VSRGLDATIVYPCGIVGPYDQARTNNITEMIIQYCRGKMPVGIQSRFDFVDVRDVARGIVAAAHLGRKGEGYILGNRQVSVPEMFELLHRETGRKRTRFFAPMRLAKAGLPFSALYYKLKRRKPLFSSCAYSLHTLGSNSLYSHEKAARELGYRRVRSRRPSVTPSPGSGARERYKGYDSKHPGARRLTHSRFFVCSSCLLLGITLS